MASARRLAANVFSGVLSNVTRILIQVIMLPLMARLLEPSDLGLYALAMPLISFVLLLSDAGLGDSLAKEKSDSTLVWSSAFWGLLGSGTVLAVCVYLASFLIGNLAGQPKLPEIMLPLSLTLLMVAATIIPSALILRGGSFTLSGIGEMIANVAGAVLAVLLAFHGFGVWALVVQYVAIYFIRMVILNWLQPFAPRFEFSAKSLLAHTGMGSQIMSGRLLELCTRMFENSQVSRQLGQTALGNYSFANQIGLFLSGSIANPLWANLYYVAITKTVPEANALYVRTHRIFALMVFPAATLLSTAMPILSPIFLGAKWDGAIHSIMIMILFGAFGSLSNFQSALLFSRDRGNVVLYGLSVTLVARIVVVILAWPFGVAGLSAGWAAVTFCYFIFTVFFVSPMVGCKWADILKAIAGPLLASILAAALFYYITTVSPTLSGVIGGGLFASLVYIGLLFAVDRNHIKGDIAAIKAMIGKQPKDNFV